MKDKDWIDTASNTIANMCVSYQLGNISKETFASNLLMFALDMNDLPLELAEKENDQNK